jgi:2-polyprenyl-3-methyl-5-hydroxy-6-metoxy-1,4-benzoquinol methylase
MMFGTRKRFEYEVCYTCKSCALVTPLDSFDLSNYYPSEYYSFKVRKVKSSWLKTYLRKKRGQHMFGSKNILGALMYNLYPTDVYKTYIDFNLGLDDKILDVGAGGGDFLQMLKDNGFRHLHGCDPFISTAVDNGDFQIEKCAIENLAGPYDVIFFNHSFEHLTEPSQSLATSRRLQRPGGRCIIRTPTTSSLAFERYGTNWVQLDPPRHITVPSREGMRILAAAVGYRLENMVDDSTAFQFCGSEQYARDIPLLADNSYWSENSIFSAADIDRFSREAQELNMANRGDQTGFVLRAV